MHNPDDRFEEMAIAAGDGLDIEGLQSRAEGPASSPLFDELTESEIADVLGAFDTQSFNAGHRVTLEGFRGREFYLIVEGRAAVSVAGRRVAELGPGDFFGEVAVLRDGLRSATVTAETRLRTLVLSNDSLEQLLVAHPRVGVNMLREVLGRFPEAGDGQAERPRALSI